MGSGKPDNIIVSFRAMLERISTDQGGGFKIVLHAFEETEAIKQLLDFKDKNCEITVAEMRGQ